MPVMPVPKPDEVQLSNVQKQTSSLALHSPKAHAALIWKLITNMKHKQAPSTHC